MRQNKISKIVKVLSFLVILVFSAQGARVQGARVDIISYSSNSGSWGTSPTMTAPTINFNYTNSYTPSSYSGYTLSNPYPPPTPPPAPIIFNYDVTPVYTYTPAVTTPLITAPIYNISSPTYTVDTGAVWNATSVTGNWINANAFNKDAFGSSILANPGGEAFKPPQPKFNDAKIGLKTPSSATLG